MLLQILLSKKILITGSNGFISKHLFHFLLSKNFAVDCTNRKISNKLYFDLEDKNNLMVSIPKFDILIHLSYFTSSSYEVEKKINLDGSKKIFLLAKNYNAKIIYVSSQSADKNSSSNYGKTKYNVEKLAGKFNAYILRPGLIYDNKSEIGLYYSIEKLVKKMPILFVPTGLKKKINLCNINKLCEQINLIINNKVSKHQIDIYENKNFYLIDLIINIAKINNRKIKIIPINYKLILLIIKVFEFLNFKMGFKSDSLKSLI